MLFGAFRAAAASTLFHGGQSDCPLFPLDMPANLEGESPLWSLQDPEQPRPFGLNVLMPLFDTEEHTSHCRYVLSRKRPSPPPLGIMTQET